VSHFAELDKNNVVLRVLVGNNNDPAGDEGYSWFVNNLGGRWVQTSYNATFRNKYAAINDIYLEAEDVFIAPQPDPSYVLDENYEWQPATENTEK